MKSQGSFFLIFKTDQEVNRTSLAKRYSEVIKLAVEAWSSNTMSNQQALILLSLLNHDLLPNNIEIPSCLEPLKKYRELEAELPDQNSLRCS